MDKTFRIGLLVGIFAAAIALFQNAQNGRYQYSTNGNQGIVVDTRTGEFWVEDGSHFEPRAAHITVHHPMILDETANDDRSQKFQECLQANLQAVRSHTDRRDCVAEQHFDFQKPAPIAPATSR
jgi:hypothetical protein